MDYDVIKKYRDALVEVKEAEKPLLGNLLLPEGGEDIQVWAQDRIDRLNMLMKRCKSGNWGF